MGWWAQGVLDGVMGLVGCLPCTLAGLRACSSTVTPSAVRTQLVREHYRCCVVPGKQQVFMLHVMLAIPVPGNAAWLHISTWAWSCCSFRFGSCPGGMSREQPVGDSGRAGQSWHPKRGSDPMVCLGGPCVTRCCG